MQQVVSTLIIFSLFAYLRVGYYRAECIPLLKIDCQAQTIGFYLKLRSRWRREDKRHWPSQCWASTWGFSLQPLAADNIADFMEQIVSLIWLFMSTLAPGCACLHPPDHGSLLAVCLKGINSGLWQVQCMKTWRHNTTFNICHLKCGFFFSTQHEILCLSTITAYFNTFVVAYRTFILIDQSTFICEVMNHIQRCGKMFHNQKETKWSEGVGVGKVTGQRPPGKWRLLIFVRLLLESAAARMCCMRRKSTWNQNSKCHVTFTF